MDIATGTIFLTTVFLVATLGMTEFPDCNGPGTGNFTTLVSTLEPQNLSWPGDVNGGTYLNFSNVDCYWKVQASSGSRRVCLRILSQSKEDNETNCSREGYLLVYNGVPGNKMAKFFGDEQDSIELCSGTVHSRDEGDFLMLHFHSDSTITKQGFLLQFWSGNNVSATNQTIKEPTTESYAISPRVNASAAQYTTTALTTYTEQNRIIKLECNGSEVLTSGTLPQILTSPSYGNESYPNNADCLWRLKAASATERVCLRVLSLDIEGTGRCCSRADYLQIYDGVAQPKFKLAEMCGTNHNAGQLCSGTLKSEVTGLLILHFHSDMVLTKQGFTLEFFTLVDSATTPSPTTATKNTATFSTLNIITRIYTSQIRDKIPTPTTSASLSTLNVTSILSTPKTTDILSARDSKANSSLLQVINLDCNNTQILKSGSIPKILTSPGYENKTYPKNADCTWRLVAPSTSQRVCLQVLNLDIEDNPSCFRADYIEIFDGRDQPQFKLAEMCGTNHNGRQLCSGTLNSDVRGLLILHFHSDNDTTKQGFTLEFSTLVDSTTTPSPTTATKNTATFSTLTTRASASTSNFTIQGFTLEFSTLVDSTRTPSSTTTIKNTASVSTLNTKTSVSTSKTTPNTYTSEITTTFSTPISTPTVPTPRTGASSSANTLTPETSVSTLHNTISLNTTATLSTTNITTTETTTPGNPPSSAVIYGSIAGSVVGAVVVLLFVGMFIRSIYKRYCLPSNAKDIEMTVL